jgi:hypothetical protein
MLVCALLRPFVTIHGGVELAHLVAERGLWGGGDGRHELDDSRT